MAKEKETKETEKKSTSEKNPVKKPLDSLANYRASRGK
jgi:hypothetical protein